MKANSIFSALSGLKAVNIVPLSDYAKKKASEKNHVLDDGMLARFTFKGTDKSASLTARAVCEKCSRPVFLTWTARITSQPGEFRCKPTLKGAALNLDCSAPKREMKRSAKSETSDPLAVI